MSNFGGSIWRHGAENRGSPLFQGLQMKCICANQGSQTCADTFRNFCDELKGILNAILIDFSFRVKPGVHCCLVVTEQVEGSLAYNCQQIAALAPLHISHWYIHSSHHLQLTSHVNVVPPDLILTPRMLKYCAAQSAIVVLKPKQPPCPGSISQGSGRASDSPHDNPGGPLNSLLI